jgi:hypothetical protein
VHELIVVSAPACQANISNAPTAIDAILPNVLPIENPSRFGRGRA